MIYHKKDEIPKQQRDTDTNDTTKSGLLKIIFVNDKLFFSFMFLVLISNLYFFNINAVN